MLALDHRSQFEALAAELGADAARIEAFKLAGLEAARRCGDGFGVLLDDRYGLTALARTADDALWVGRPIERAGSRPLEFEGGADVGVILREWPLGQVVKCLVRYHPDDAPELKTRQERQLLRLFHAARATRHELLLELIAGWQRRGGGRRAGADLRARREARLVEAGAARRRGRLGAGRRHDRGQRSALPRRADAGPGRRCRRSDSVFPGGGAGATSSRDLRSAARSAEAPARAYLAGEIDDAEATRRLAAGLGALADAWDAAKAGARSRPAAE